MSIDLPKPLIFVSRIIQENRLKNTNKPTKNSLIEYYLIQEIKIFGLKIDNRCFGRILFDWTVWALQSAKENSNIYLV